MITLKGTIKKILYRNESNMYTVVSLKSDDDDEEVTCVGCIPSINEEEYVEITGDFIVNKKYGEQIAISGISVIVPTDEASMERYLASGSIKNIGPKKAKDIVKKFGKDTFRIIAEEPERLAEIKGISERMAMEIGVFFAEKYEQRDAIMFLSKFNISNTLAIKIYNFYGKRLYDVIRNNPYRIIQDIPYVGFKTADEIALNAGIQGNDGYRIGAALYYTLMKCVQRGHTYYPKQMLFKEAREFVQADDEEFEVQLVRLTQERTVIIKQGEDDIYVYPKSFYYKELNTARMLTDLNISYDVTDKHIEDAIKNIEKSSNIELDDLQKDAVRMAARHGIFILTGGPGTGKTTSTNAIITYFENEGMEVLLTAPTGRAAKRMSEATGKEAKTIHRLLEFSGGTKKDENDTIALLNGFGRNEENPLETDVLIVDEMSMVDINLMYALLKAVTVGTRMILVGDADQLPSVGPGNVLKDMIGSGSFKSVRLTRIFRQAEESDIVLNAHRINMGHEISLENKAGSDFFFIKRMDSDVIVEAIIYMIKKKISEHVGVSPMEVQVLTPSKTGELGTEKLNEKLQAALNPPDSKKAEKKLESGKCLRVGDKVMQIKNDYQLEWSIKGNYGIVLESGTGVFNGESGIIKDISNITEKVVVEFEEGKLVEYPYSALDEIVLAYAITIHKSQGSEYPAVIIPLLYGPELLLNRNVLYTAITRAKRCVLLIGSEKTVNKMIENVSVQKRYSGLESMIKEMVIYPYQMGETDTDFEDNVDEDMGEGDLF